MDAAMRHVSTPGLVFVALALAPAAASAQVPAPSPAAPVAWGVAQAPPRAAVPGASPQDAVSPASPPAWTGFFNVDTYFLPEEEDYLQPTIAADRGRLHLEARYNYEDYRTGSAFAGFNAAGGSAVTWAVTPMVGVSFGRTAAAVPAFRGSLAFWRIEASAEGEWAFAFDDEDDSFFYTWLEADLSLTDWMWAGLSSQTTKVFGEPQDTEWGPVVGFAIGPLDLATYVFNLGQSRPSVIVSAILNFGAD